MISTLGCLVSYERPRRGTSKRQGGGKTAATHGNEMDKEVSQTKAEEEKDRYASSPLVSSSTPERHPATPPGCLLSRVSHFSLCLHLSSPRRHSVCRTSRKRALYADDALPTARYAKHLGVTRAAQVPLKSSANYENQQSPDP